MKQVPAKWKKRFQNLYFINGHGGFLNEDFRLFSTNNQSGELTYQRFLNGYPTFNKEGSNQIQVTWGEKGVFDYRRSLLRTDVVLNSEDNKTLPKLEVCTFKLSEQ
ncbi:two-component system activity regulator YycH [Staphylococcus aureus]